MIEFKNVEKYYGDFHALKNINLNISKGEVVVVIGPSGSGKSTMLRCINALEEITTGELLVEGVNLKDKKTNLNEVRKNLGMVFQHFNLYPHRTVLDNITLAPMKVAKKSKEEAQKKAEELLAKVGMLDKKAAYPSQLSGGQQQRLCIARAIAMKPDILLLDEPASALDPISTSKVEETIVNLKKDYSIVIVTHNMQQAARISDYTAFFYLGHAIEYDETSKVFTRPKIQATEDYVSGHFG